MKIGAVLRQSRDIGVLTSGVKRLYLVIKDTIFGHITLDATKCIYCNNAFVLIYYTALIFDWRMFANGAVWNDLITSRCSMPKLTVSPRFAAGCYLIFSLPGFRFPFISGFCGGSVSTTRSTSVCFMLTA